MGRSRVYFFTSRHFGDQRVRLYMEPADETEAYIHHCYTVATLQKGQSVLVAA